MSGYLKIKKVIIVKFIFADYSDVTAIKNMSLCAEQYW